MTEWVSEWVSEDLVDLGAPERGRGPKDCVRIK